MPRGNRERGQVFVMLERFEKSYGICALPCMKIEFDVLERLMLL
jgi:hypothetical protein